MREDNSTQLVLSLRAQLHALERKQGELHAEIRGCSADMAALKGTSADPCRRSTVKPRSCDASCSFAQLRSQLEEDMLFCRSEISRQAAVIQEDEVETALLKGLQAQLASDRATLCERLAAQRRQTDSPLMQRLQLEADVAVRERTKLRLESERLALEANELADVESASSADADAQLEVLAERRCLIAKRDRRLSLALSYVDEAFLDYAPVRFAPVLSVTSTDAKAKNVSFHIEGYQFG